MGNRYSKKTLIKIHLFQQNLAVLKHSKNVAIIQPIKLLEMFCASSGDLRTFYIQLRRHTRNHSQQYSGKKFQLNKRVEVQRRKYHRSINLQKLSKILLKYNENKRK